MRTFVPALILVAGLAMVGAGCDTATSPTMPTGTPSSTTLTPSSTSPVMSDTLAFPGILPTEEINKKVRITTTKGDIVIQLDPQAGPNAASNFVYLIKKDFYQGTIFHRVIPGFMIQGGDPTGTGFSGPGYTIPDDQVKNLPSGRISVNGMSMNSPYYAKGTVAMANTGAPRSAGSQFFIMVSDYPLPPSYSIFGKVIEGQEIADAISNVARDESDRPEEEVRMTSIVLE